jgi:proteasome lid subunit RPN8/RPN11
VYPEEGCGLLAGSNGQVSQQYPIENILHSQTAYEMDALQQVNTMLTIEAQAEDLLAIYHSHPNSPALPSETDIAQAYYPEAVTIIVSLADRAAPIMRGFQISAGLVSEVPLISE